MSRHVGEEPYKSTADVHGWMGLCSFNIARKGRKAALHLPFWREGLCTL